MPNMKSFWFLCALPLATLSLMGTGEAQGYRAHRPRDEDAAGILGRIDGPPEQPGSRRRDRESVRPPDRIEAPRGRPGARRRDQDAAYAAMRHGAVLPLREIEGRIVPRMPGAFYLGPEFDSASGTYRLKFMTRGLVTWIDVDGRTGAIINRSGN
jgi:hypothetical protein